jgi:hypothetical protein
MVFRDLVKDVLRTLWTHKLRSALTMFGIAWGIVSRPSAAPFSIPREPMEPRLPHPYLARGSLPRSVARGRDRVKIFGESSTTVIMNS